MENASCPVSADAVRDPGPRYRMGFSLSVSMVFYLAGTLINRFTFSGSQSGSFNLLAHRFHRRSSLLHTEGNVETGIGSSETCLRPKCHHEQIDEKVSGGLSGCGHDQPRHG